MKKTTRRNLFLFSTAFILPFLAQLIIFALVGIWPFGNRSILTLDMHNQYVSYFAYLQQILKGRHSLLYTFSKTIGGDMLGFAAYYLISPVNLILVFFSRETLPLAIELITLIKIGLCGLTCSVCLHSSRCMYETACSVSASGAAGRYFPDEAARRRLPDDISLQKPGYAFMLPAFSCCYALMAYNIANEMNPMWLDCVICLPLIILGIKKILSGGRPFLYIISLGCALMTSFYIGYMLCLGSVIFFLCSLPTGAGTICVRVKRTAVYAVSSLLAGGLSMWIILPSFFSLEGGNGGFNIGVLYDLTGNYSLHQFFEKALSGTGKMVLITDGMPNIYCGILTLLFVWLFFLSSGISVRKKICAFILCAVMVLSMYLKGINLLWHGLNSPSWFLYRYSFIFCFFLIFIAWQGYCSYKQVSFRSLLITQAVFLIPVLALAVLAVREQPDGMAPANVLINAGFALLFCLLNLACAASGTDRLSHIRRQKQSGFLILALCLTELVINGAATQRVFYQKKHTDYVSFVQKTEPAVEEVRAMDDSLYRMEKTFLRKESDPMLLDFRGLSHYSSSDKLIVREFMGQSGFRNNGNWAYYNRGSTYAMDSLLGVKYILSQKKMPKPYQLVDKTAEGIRIYRNPYALPLALTVSGPVTETVSDPVTEAADGPVTDTADTQTDVFDFNEPNKFVFQNRLWKTLTGSGRDLFIQEGDYTISVDNLADEGNGYYRKQDAEHTASITFSFKAGSENPIFGWFGTDDRHPVQMYINDKKKGSYFSIYQYDIFRIGAHKTGDPVEIRLELSDTDVINVTDVWFYHQDMAVFEEFYQSLAADVPAITSFSDRKITVEADVHTDVPANENADAENTRVLFTIPVEDGWKATVDGEPAEIETALGLFISVPVPEGTHQIELTYIPKGLLSGLGICVGSIVLILLLYIAGKHRNYMERNHRSRSPG